MTKCKTCNKEYSITCDYNQGRCPHHPPQVNAYTMRYFNLYRIIKNLFSRTKSNP